MAAAYRHHALRQGQDCIQGPQGLPAEPGDVQPFISGNMAGQKVRIASCTSAPYRYRETIHSNSGSENCIVRWAKSSAPAREHRCNPDTGFSVFVPRPPPREQGILPPPAFPLRGSGSSSGSSGDPAAPVPFGDTAPVSLAGFPPPSWYYTKKIALRVLGIIVETRHLLHALSSFLPIRYPQNASSQ